MLEKNEESTLDDSKCVITLREGDVPSTEDHSYSGVELCKELVEPGSIYGRGKHAKPCILGLEPYGQQPFVIFVAVNKKYINVLDQNIELMWCTKAS